MRHSSPESRTFRVASLNLMNSTARLEERYALLLQELERLQPDALCLQEVLVEERTRLDSMLRTVGFQSSAYSTPLISDVVVGGGSISYGNAIFTRAGEDQVTFHELSFDADHDRLALPPTRFGLNPSIIAILNLGEAGGEVQVMSSHFAWGQGAEATRLLQASVVDEYAEQVIHRNPAAVVIMGADMNCVPESATARFLHGFHPNLELKSTHWVDTWRMWGTPENEFTSVPATNSWSHATAVNAASALQGVAQVRPELVPARRIDYLLSYGWVYGRRGGPLNHNLWAERSYGGLEISDHAGIVSDFLL